MKSRKVALEILERGLKKSFISKEEWDKLSKLDKRDRDFVRKLVYGTVRFTPLLDEALGKFLKKPTKTPFKVKNILRMGTYEIVFLRVPFYATVNEYTDLAPKKMKGLVNAVLRKVASSDVHIDISFSKGLDEWLKEELGDDFELFLKRSMSHRLSLRSVKVSRDKLRGMISEKVKCRYMEFSPWGLTCDEGEDLRNELFEKGMFTFQDESSQLVAIALSPQKGERILDACGGVGTKTTHILQISPFSHVVYNDVNKEKRKAAKANFERMKLFPNETKNVDLLGVTYELGDAYDKILLDAPCSALGTVGKHPDVLLRITPAEAKKNARRQLAMLENVWPLLKKGGVLIYSVCTVTNAETDGVMKEFLRRHDDAKTVDPFDGMYEFKFNGLGVQLLKYMEGFYLSKIVKV